MAWHSLGKVTVPASGTPVRITINETIPSARLACHAIMIQAIPTNTGRIIVGRSGMNSTTYADCLAIIAIPTANVIQSANASMADVPNGLNAADYFIDATVNGEAALVSYLVA